MPKKSRQPLNLDHLDRIDRPTRERIYQRIVEEEAIERARALESRGWRAWYAEMFDIPPSEDNPEGVPFVSRLAPHHIEAIEWHWNSLILKRAGLDITEYAYFAIWSRGHMKSTLARYMAICDAALSGKGYCLYVSGTKGKVRGHAISIETLLGSAKVAEYYPKLSQVMKGQEGQSKGWQANFIYTAAGYVFHFISLDEGVAGANVDSIRPTLITLDDIDERGSSVVISENRLRVLTRAVLPTRQKGTLVIWAQNLISRHSVLYHIYTGKERVLTSRVQTKPVPAFINFQTEVQLVNGVLKDVIVSGEPTWPWYDKDRAQEEIDTIGVSAFRAECMHEVDQDLADAVLPEFNEHVHLITWEEFNAVYGLPANNRDVPANWRRFVGHDWGSTPQHANVVGWVSVAAANTHFPGTAFLYHFKSFPASTLAGTVARAVLNYTLADTQRDPHTYIELGLLDRGTSDPSDALATKARQRVTEALSQLDSYAMWHLSHEAKAVRDIYRMVYGLPFQACNPKRDGGVAQLRHYLRYDMSQPHPFRPGKSGLARMYIIVENEAERERPTGDSGMKLVREQLPEWRWRPSELTSQGFMDERPMKINDDVGNMLMMIFTHFKLYATPLSSAEQVLASIPSELQYANLLANSPHDAGLTPEQELSHLFALTQAHRHRTEDIERFTEWGEPVDYSQR